MALVFSQTNPDLSAALEEFEVRLLNYEHMLRKTFYHLHCTMEETIQVSRIYHSYLCLQYEAKICKAEKGHWISKQDFQVVRCSS